MDGLNPHGPQHDFSISGTAKVDLLDRMIAQAHQRNRVYVPDPKTEAGYFYRSDHFSFAKRGVPAISYKSGEDWEQGGLAAGKAWREAYVKDDYHQPSDQVKPDWTFTGMARDLDLVYATGRDLADSPDWPNWSQDSEFRAARDESAGQRK
jgi:Zn-dependent M28 family amino/carboxypeptidase